MSETTVPVGCFVFHRSATDETGTLEDHLAPMAASAWPQRYVMQAGGCPCFVEPGLTAEALLARARAVGMRRIVLDQESEAMARDLEHGGVQVRLTADLLRKPRDSESAGVIHEPLGPADLAMMQFTSGSTALPKGALLTHGNLLRHAEGIIERTALTAADRLLHVMPLHHTNGVNNQLIAPFLVGATVVLAERFRAEDVEDQIAAHGVTYLTGVSAPPCAASRLVSSAPGRAQRRPLEPKVRSASQVPASCEATLVLNRNLRSTTGGCERVTSDASTAMDTSRSPAA